jgi:hypothetical protein
MAARAAAMYSCARCKLVAPDVPACPSLKPKLAPGTTPRRASFLASNCHCRATGLTNLLRSNVTTFPCGSVIVTSSRSSIVAEGREGSSLFVNGVESLVKVCE